MSIKIIVFLFLVAGSNMQANSQENYPAPARTDKLLFYFQRSHNKNTIVYDLNTLSDGKINIDKPVTLYWIRYEEGGVKKDLSFIQRKAFGLQWELVDKSKESFILHFNSFKKREIYLIKSASKYKALITINGELAELNRLFIKSENNSLGIPLKIRYVEISGINLKSGKSVVEKIVP